MSRLERVTYLCLIALCLVSGTILVREHFYKPSSWLNNQPAPSSLVGKRLDVPQANWGSSKLHAVVFLSTHCRFCDASMPFYRQMVLERQRESGQKVTLWALSPEPSEVIMRHLADNDVEFDHAYQISFPNALLKVTPILLFVDSSGIIRQAEIGQLPTAQQNKVMEIFRAGSLV